MEKTLEPGNPFKRVPLISAMGELDRAIRKAVALPLPRVKKNAFTNHKIRLLNRIEYIEQHLINKLERVLKAIPKINHLHEFYVAMIDIYSDRNIFKKTLGRINGAIRVIRKISGEYKSLIRTSKTIGYRNDKDAIKYLYKLWRQYLARLSSFINEINDAFIYLNNLMKILRKLPDYNPELPTIVVCGPPNSGKSSLVGALSNARVEIAEYPFTTKELVFGHIIMNTIPPVTIQIVDSPGLFDRPLQGRKKEELLALEAIRTIANCVIFLFDCSYERTIDINGQLSIFDEVISFLGNRNMIVALNKSDIKDPSFISKILGLLEARNIKPLLISVKYKYGLNILLNKAVKILFGHRIWKQ